MARRGNTASASETTNEVNDRFGYQPALDGIRALAVLGVIAYHDAYSWAKGGFLGVDAFFVLSGFLITTLLILEWRRAQGIAFIAFWGRRIRRLLPALLLVILFVAVYAYFAVPSQKLDRIRGDGIAGLFYVANWRFIATGTSYFDLFSAPSPFRHLWSLAIEEQFYLVWPPIVFVCLKIAKGHLRVLVGVCVVGTIASVWLMSALYNADDPSRAYFGTDSRAHTILVGCLLAILLLQWRPTSRQAHRALQALGVLGALGVIWAWHDVSDIASGYYGIGSLAYAIAVAAVIAAAVQPGRGLIRTPLSWTPLRWIGMISYGLYLWHWPINVWLSATRVPVGATTLNVLRLVVTFAAATASYYLVELPVRRGAFLGLKRAGLRWVAPAGVVLVAATLLITTAGAKPLPQYLIAIGRPGPCRDPIASERQAAAAALQRYDGARLTSAGTTRSVMLVGDSLACSLQPGLAAVGQTAGIRSGQAAVVGCGVVADTVAPTRGEGTMHNTDLCHAIVRKTHQRAMAKIEPDVVLWLSSWERLSIVDGERTLLAGTPRRDTVILERMDRMLERLTAGGARLGLVTVAPFTRGTGLGQDFRSNPERDREVLHLNDLLRRFAARHPDRAFVVDLARHVCPDGAPCGPDVDGRRPRPDGAHFSPSGAVWAAEWALAEVAKSTSPNKDLPIAG